MIIINNIKNRRVISEQALLVEINSLSEFTAPSLSDF